MSLAELHDFSSNSTQGRDSTRSKPSTYQADSGHKTSKVALRLDKWRTPPWVDSQLKSGMKRSSESVFTSVQEPGALGRLAEHEDHWEVGVCRKLCEHGRITDAVNALNILVQRGCHVPNNLFYRVLKRCVLPKDLALGRRIHALTIKCGYAGDTFLATHLIGLYAVHGRLKEAMEVFTLVSAPTVYNWATIIFAYARHGEAAQAIRLYRQMRQMNVKPNNRIYLAVLKACATAGDSVAGQEVHAHILASPGKPDVFVQTGLVDMYAKCGSLLDARSVFDKFPDRNVVTWNAMISGYAQQGLGWEALDLYNSMQQEGIIPPDSVTFVCLLQACARVGEGALHQGTQLHAQIAKRGLLCDVVVGGSLVTMYTKCGSTADARRVFDRLTEKNLVTWTSMISGYAQHGMGQEALCLYSIMQQEGITPPDSVTFVCLLHACASVGVEALLQGNQLHAQIEEVGLQDDVVLGGSLVTMYAKCGSIEDARRVFDRLPERNVVTWTAMLAGYTQQGMGLEALSLYNRMQQDGVTAPGSVTFVCLLQACSSVGAGALNHGKQLHVQIEELELLDDVAVGSSLVNMYAKCGALDDARNIFDKLPVRDVVTWTAMIAAYAQQGMGHEALALYNNMQDKGVAPDSFMFACLLQACASVGVGALHQGKQFHAQIAESGLQNDEVLGTCLTDMYTKCGSVEDARSVFDLLPHKNVVTWTTIIAAYAQQGMGEGALTLYGMMQQEGITCPNSVTFVCLLQACARIGALHQGMQLHAQIEEQGLQYDVVLGGSLVSMYVKCGSVEAARRLFDRLPDKNVVTWNVMLSGYAQQGMGEEALALYDSMQQEGVDGADCFTVACLLQACASVAALPLGKHLHAQIDERGLHNDVVVCRCLIDMYAKCGSLEDARSVFDKLGYRDVVTWNAMLAGYVQQGMVQEALALYGSMQDEGITPPDPATFVCLLQACATDAALPMGKQLHAQIEERGLQTDLVVAAALVNMYAKCGSMFDAQKVFESLPERTIEAWGALTDGYTRQGDSDIVFDLLDKMGVEGIQPNGITFLSVLTMCSHMGLVDRGRKFFDTMRTHHSISPTVEHYTCMIDLFGRAGHLEEALQIAKTMPFPPDGAAWRTLLGACRKWNNVEIGQLAFEFAVSVDGQHSAPYMLMSSIYSSAQMWEEAMEMQARRVQCRAWKKPGQSWLTDMDGTVQTFLARDKEHPESEGTYEKLNS